MGPRNISCSAVGPPRLRGDRVRLLGRCFTLTAQRGRADLVTLALRCKADIEQRINGQSALDGAAQAGQFAIAKALLDAGAVATQTATSRWTPLMRASQGGHHEICGLLLNSGVSPDEWADRSTALDIAEAHGHDRVTKLLRENNARRFLELSASERKVASNSGAAALGASLALANANAYALQRIPRARLDGPQPYSRPGARGVLWGTAVLHLRQGSVDNMSGTEDSDETDASRF
eukprot:TRINITY_DN26698_c0_g1_i1.p1 TRINITY_DN26698_c0_g1~~TRINITY_DN26698_c0_g1_i1.p1  ORF type:complete len:244 (-),score=41.19 TRINITY_DN26698_c0_g1_i1:379-1083(-)